MAPLESMALLGLSLGAMLIWGAYWLAAHSRVWVTTSPNGRLVSLMLCLVPQLVGAALFQDRGASALYTTGLSATNKVEAIFTVIAAIWALWLLYGRAVPIRGLLAGPMYWVSLLVVAYTLSAFWSVWPTLTLYRSVELAAYTVIGFHLLSHRDAYRWFGRLLLGLLLVTIVSTALINGIAPMIDGTLFGGLRSNTGGLLAAAYLLQLIHETVYGERRPRTWRFALSIGGLLLFGSLSSVVAAMASVPIGLSFRAGRHRWWLTSLGAVGVIVVGAWFVTRPMTFSEQLVAPIAEVSGKTPAMILTVTGRLPLWTAVYRATRDKPFGQGFVAAERSFVLIGRRETSIGWQARSAHSGYVSAWMGAGWVGVLPLLAIFASVGARVLRMRAGQIAWLLPILMLLAINNLTVIGIGGQYNPAWLVVIGLACAPPIAAVGSTTSLGGRESSAVSHHWLGGRS